MKAQAACSSAQSHQSLSCSHTWSMEVGEGSDKKIRHLAPLDGCMSVQSKKSSITSWLACTESLNVGKLKGSAILDIRKANFASYTNETRQDKTNKMSVHPEKTQISLGICPVWSESLLCAFWIGKDLMQTLKTDQTGQMPMLIWVFAGCRGHFGCFVVLRLK